MIARFYTRIGKLANLQMENNLKDNFVLRSAALSAHKKDMIVCAASSSDEIHLFTSALRNEYVSFIRYRQFNYLSNENTVFEESNDTNAIKIDEMGNQTPIPNPILYVQNCTAWKRPVHHGHLGTVIY